MVNSICDTIINGAEMVVMVLMIMQLCYRLDFSIDKENKGKTEEIKREKIKAEELLRNFIPEHVRKAMEVWKKFN